MHEEITLPEPEVVFTEYEDGGMYFLPASKRAVLWSNLVGNTFNGYVFLGFTLDTVDAIAWATPWQMHDGKAIYRPYAKWRKVREKEIILTQLGHDQDSETIRVAPDGSVVGVTDPKFAASLRMGGSSQNADRLARRCAEAVIRGEIDARSAIADALLDYMRVGSSGGPEDVHEWLANHPSEAAK